MSSSNISSSPKREDAKPIMQCKKMSFSALDVCIVILSIGTFIVDLSTDIILVANYFNHGHIYWAIGTLLLILLPAIVVQMFSIRWYIADESTDYSHWIAHIFLMGILHRYALVLKTGLEARTSGEITDFQRLFHQQSDICMLHLFESFLESAPQLVLQLYIMVTMEDWYSWTAVSAAASLGSLAWAVAAYTRAMRRARPDKCCVSWPGLVLQAAWRGGMLTARISALVVFAVGFQAWIFLLLGAHWIGMTTWVIFQKTDFCPTQWEERAYNCVVGAIYCFCFFNLREGRSRHRALTFYIVAVVQNMACLGLFVAVAGASRPGLATVATVTVVGGTLLGMCSMLLYYRFFHPAGPIAIWAGTVTSDPEPGIPTSDIDKLATLRSLKGHCPRDRVESLDKSDEVQSQEGSPHSDLLSDKKLLLSLTRWASGKTILPSLAVDEDMDGVEIEELEATVEAVNLSGESVNLPGESVKFKRRGICSPAELVQKLDEDKEEMREDSNKESSEVRKSKRRAICSLEPEMEVELELSLEVDDTDCQQQDGRNERDSSQKWKLKQHGMSASQLNKETFHINKFNGIDPGVTELTKDDALLENGLPSKESPCLDAESLPNDNKLSVLNVQSAQNEDSPSEILSAPSEVLSMHDYENICAVNIARETWGLRSWQGYSDIETWLHDDSVVRDRRRDTFSTVTSVSSDRSAAGSPPPLPCRRPAPATRSRQDDYLDTLVDDLADCLAEPDFDAGENVFVARPCVVDQHGMFFPLDTIVEEEETSSDTPRHSHGSASTLVATIDEIRSRGSLSNIYNSQEDLWKDSSQSIVDQVYKTPVTSSLMTLTHSRSHLSPEEVFFLSKLQAAPDRNVKSNLMKLSQISSENIGIIPYTSAVTDDVDNNSNEEELEIDEKGGKKRMKPRRKVSLLREKFEVTKRVNFSDLDHFSSPADCHLTAVYSEPPLHGSKVNILESVLQENRPIVFYNKENVTPAVTSRISQWNSILKKPIISSSKQSLDSTLVISVPAPIMPCEYVKSSKSNFANLKERRSTFLKQVLSPPKFQAWGKKGSLSPKSKIVPAT